RTTACSPCTTAARTRVGRYHRASSTATRWPARCITGVSAWSTARLKNRMKATPPVSPSRWKTAWCTSESDHVQPQNRQRTHKPATRSPPAKGLSMCTLCSLWLMTYSDMQKTDMQETKSTCCYCGVGCGVIIESESNRITGVRGDPQHPANFGRLCTKGSTLHLSAKAEGRALQPELRRGRDLPRQTVSWDESLDYVADRFAAIIREHGPDAVAFYISGQLLTEDYYVFNKLAKGLIGTNNVDTNSRLCM